MYNDDERERPSWREIDKKKDRSRFVRDEKIAVQSKRQKSIVANYKHKLKEAFRNGKVAETIDKLEGDSPEKRERRENMQILRTSSDIKKFEAALRWYISQKPKIVEDEIINRALNFDNPDLSIAALEVLKSAENFKDIANLSNIREKLVLLSMTARVLKLKLLAKEIITISGE